MVARVPCLVCLSAFLVGEYTGVYRFLSLLGKWLRCPRDNNTRHTATYWPALLRGTFVLNWHSCSFLFGVLHTLYRPDPVKCWKGLL